MMREDTPSLPCKVSNLDWISYEQGPITIKAGKGKQARNPFRRQIEICNACHYQDPCLELGLVEDWGIWGGKFPYERRAILARRTL